MKLLVIGIGDCGCRLAGEFARLNRRAKAERHVNIVTSAYAVNNDRKQLSKLTRARTGGLRTIPVDGSLEAGESSEVSAQFMRERADRITEAIRGGELFGADASLFIVGVAGSFASGGAPVLAQHLRGYFMGKPVYALAVLPFESEEKEPRCIYNAAVCLNSITKVADAVFLVDNEKFRGGLDIASDKGLGALNGEIVAPFYDLLCASEMAGSGYAGARSLGTGDMIQTMAGWTAIGIGKTQLSKGKVRNFQDKGSETLRTLEAMNSALKRLSLDCRSEDVGKALYLLSAPSKEANIDMDQALGNKLREIAGNAEIRGGDFYGADKFVQVTVLMSQLAYVDKVKSYYDRAVELAQSLKAENDGAPGG